VCSSSVEFIAYVLNKFPVPFFYVLHSVYYDAIVTISTNKGTHFVKISVCVYLLLYNVTFHVPSSNISFTGTHLPNLMYLALTFPSN